MALDPRQIRLAARIGQGALVVGAALTAGAFALPTPEPPPPPVATATDAQIQSAQRQVEQAIEEARSAAAKALVQPEDWSTLAAGLSEVRPPEKPKPAQLAQGPEETDDEPAQPEPEPVGPRPAHSNSILATWRYVGPIIVGDQKYAVLTIRGKQVLMGIGEESQAFRLIDVAPEQLLVQDAGGATYVVALASPAEGAQTGSLPATGARPGPRSMRDMTVGSRDGSPGGGER